MSGHPGEDEKHKPQPKKFSSPCWVRDQHQHQVPTRLTGVGAPSVQPTLVCVCVRTEKTEEWRTGRGHSLATLRRLPRLLGLGGLFFPLPTGIPRVCLSLIRYSNVSHHAISAFIRSTEFRVTPHTQSFFCCFFLSSGSRYPPCLLPKANAASAVERENRPGMPGVLNNNPRRNKDSGGGSPNHTSSNTMWD